MNTPSPMPDPFAVPLDHLLAQREFVRRLARSLLRDDSAADDVAQDVMVRALGERSPVRSIRGFLATLTRRQVANTHRAATRRVEHESRASRGAMHGEACEGDAQRSLETSQLVAAEVLALDEPYRGVILRLYFDGHSAESLAKLRGVPAATIRTQHKRALEQLRERLDRRHGGRREMWSAGLTALVQGARTTSGAAAPIAVAVAVVATLTAVWRFAPWRASQGVSDDVAAAPASVTPPSGAAELSSEDSSAMPSAGARAALAALAQVPQRDTLGAAELLDLASAVQSVLRERMLAVPPPIAALATSFSASASSGVARVLERDAYGFEQPNVLGIRGGGATYSFTLRSHSYNRAPQLALEKGAFMTAFYGSSGGAVVDFGDSAIAHLSQGGPTRQPQLVVAWRLLSRDFDHQNLALRRDFAAEVDRLDHGRRPAATTGHTYVIRSIAEREFDVLVAVRVLAVDGDGAWIAWELLREWPMPDTEVNTWPEVWAPVPSAVPEWLRQESTPDLVELARSLASRARDALASSALIERRLPANTSDGGVMRLLRTWTFGWLFPDDAGASHFSFETVANVYDEQADLTLDSEGRLNSGCFGGTRGYIVDLGGGTLAEVGSHPARLPANASAVAARAWSELWAGEPNDDELSRLKTDFAEAHIRHVYAVRTIRPRQDFDALVALEVAEVDANGCTIRWKLLKRW